MPRENRKRGKKHKKNEEQQQPHAAIDLAQVSQNDPSWIKPPLRDMDDPESEAPFGLLDADVKAYFRTVDIQIRDWQEDQEATWEDNVDPNEKKRLFFMAALNEMRGKEKQLATDAECSIILERMLYSMDDFVRRVFVDSLAGSYGVLTRHRFASHVCQTLFSVARDTINREVSGILPDLPASSAQGELRTLTLFVLDICAELEPEIPSLISHPFASHAVRGLFLLLCPNLAGSNDNQSTVRSKKSAAWKAKQGRMSSVFSEGKGKRKDSELRNSPSEFQIMARRFIEVVRNKLDDNEVRAMVANEVACPSLKLLLELEADQDMYDDSGSLMDRVTMGIITACRTSVLDDITESDYLSTLLRDSNASHVLETVVSRCPADAFNVLWKTYFESRLARLAVHPVANFVVAKALERVSEGQLSKTLEELEGSWKRLIQTARTGVLRAIIDRISALNASEPHSIADILFGAFGIEADNKQMLVPCILTNLPLADYQNASSSQVDELPSPKQQGNRIQRTEQKSLEVKIQGSLLLQSLLRLPHPLNQFIVAGIFDMPVQERIRAAHDPAGSRIYDVFFDSPTVPSKAKQHLVMDFIGHYHQLVDDKLGSRVGDRCWTVSDTYLKEKVARSLIATEQELAASFYGKFFARNLNLYLLRRRPDQWRDLQSSRRHVEDQEHSATLPAKLSSPKAKKTIDKRKRKNRSEDEIDVLFDERLGKPTKKAAVFSVDVASASPETPNTRQAHVQNGDLEQVYGAIRFGSRK